jgi:hypothetical protein
MIERAKQLEQADFSSPYDIAMIRDEEHRLWLTHKTGLAIAYFHRPSSLPTSIVNFTRGTTHHAARWVG